MTNYLSENNKRISKLRKLIYDTLDPLITNDYCLLDIPDHKNIGDNLIWAGELAYLKRLPYKMVYTANLFLTDKSRISPKSTILLHGGGNFGDVWRIVQDYRNDIISQFKNQKIIIFPQTVHYDDLEFLKEDATIFDEHPDLTICTRDQKSFELLTSKFTKNTILLLPDMAFCLDFEASAKTVQNNKILVLKREDKELSKDFDELNVIPAELVKANKIEVKDWPTFNITAKEEKRDELIYKINIKLSKILMKLPVLKKLVDHRYGLIGRNSMEKYIKNGIDFINQYDIIYTTRLHGFILAILLGKEVYIIDNYYGKNSGFFNAWLKEFEKAALHKKS